MVCCTCSRSVQILSRRLKVSQLRVFHIIAMDTVPPAASGVRSASSFLFDKAFVDGQWVGAKSGSVYQITNPSTGKVIGSVPDMNADDTQQAIEKANLAFLKWRDTTAKERSLILRKWFDLTNQNTLELAKLMTAENGKPLQQALAEISTASGFIEWYAEEAKRVYGDIIPSTAASKKMLVLKQPIGVAGMITPWNFPSAMITRKACAAIAAGCTVVLKPAEDTPFSALAMCQLAKEAGVPDGVLNVVTSSRDNAPAVGNVLCTSPIIKKISFTGSTVTGKILLKQSASTVKKVSLELGGNAAFIVFDSGDIEAAVRGTMVSKFRCSGQACVSANRILVQEGVYDRYVARLGEVMKQELRVGDGFDDSTTQGPLINSKAVDKVEGIVEDAKRLGARVGCGGKRSDKGVNFFEPTLLSDVTLEMRCAKEEIFGPVAAVMKFKTEEEAVAIANSTSYGLAGYFYSRNLSQIWRVAEKLEVGLCGVNEGFINATEAPFGGVKESGLGREGGKYGIDEFLEIKYLCLGGI
ncbi:succinate-semialdehyde dehydrogenase [NADP(+)] GabD-like [Haliotis cracherodii]|uniref:succinate-semialdehyde dehydrogenase [NADP(+)] GabD-like n=1 Tax=Haliotis cracherodii TaxID=6455 RepID=UPI0039EAFFB8